MSKSQDLNPIKFQTNQTLREIIKTKRSVQCSLKINLTFFDFSDVFKSAVPLRIASTDERNGRIRNFRITENRENLRESDRRKFRGGADDRVCIGKVQVIICYCFSFQQNTGEHPEIARQPCA